MKKELIAIAIALSALTACSANPPKTFGEQLAERSSSADALAKKWQDADDKRKKGLKLIEKGKKDLTKAQEKMDKANRDIQNGQTMVSEAETTMQETETEVRALSSTPLQIPSTPNTMQPAAE
ncbi:MAG: hypothetical protein IT489_03095 [Gammaproteobacteria bacterium]|nr:hypothetical protein [Gammaproteobacteria bacterium]